MRKGLQGVAPDGGGQGGALAQALRRAALLARGPGLVVVISDFREGEIARGGHEPRADAEAAASAAGSPPYPAPGGAAGRPEWARALAALSARHDVLAVEVVDRRESALPDVGQITFVDPETGARMEADTSSAELRRRFEAAELARRDGLKRLLRGVRAQHVELDTDGDWLRQLGRSLK